MKKTVLFVDDEEINLFVLSRRFENDYHVFIANTAEEAIQIIHDKSITLHAVISDLKMPDMSGLQMIEQSKDRLTGIPCFLLTGYDHSDQIELALSSGLITRLFKKPFNYHEIKIALKELLH